MADSKVQDLTKRVLSSLANLTGVRIWSGKTGESDALGIEMSELLSSSPVTGADNPDYKALTPKGFRDSVMTETERGVGSFADDTAIAAKTGDTLLRSGKQAEMQEQWKKDFFIKDTNETVYGVYRANADDTDMGALNFEATCFMDNFGAGASRIISPPLPAGKVFKAIYYSLLLKKTGTGLFYTTAYLEYNGSSVSAPIGASNCSVDISSDGRTVSIFGDVTTVRDYWLSARVLSIIE